MGMSPGGAKSNIAYVDGKVEYDNKMVEDEKLLINDPQTSGGLLIFVGEEEKNKLVKLYQDNNLEYYEIGRIFEKNEDMGSICIKVNKK